MNTQELYLRALHAEITEVLPEGFNAKLVPLISKVGFSCLYAIQVLGPKDSNGLIHPYATIHAKKAGFTLDRTTDRLGQYPGNPVWRTSRYRYEEPSSIERLINMLLLSCNGSPAHGRENSPRGNPLTPAN